MSDSRHSSHSKSFQTNCRFADASRLPTSLAFNVACAVAPMDYRLDGYIRRIEWYVFTDNVSYRHENLTASEPLVPSPLHPRYLFPEQSAMLSHLPPPSRRLSLPAIAATTSLYLLRPLSPHCRPSTTQIYLACYSDSFSVITSELYVVSFTSNYLGVS